MKYCASVIIAFLSVFLVLAFIAVMRLNQINAEIRLTREAMQELRDDAKTYNEWIQNVTNPAIGVK